MITVTLSKGATGLYLNQMEAYDSTLQRLADTMGEEVQVLDPQGEHILSYMP